MKRNIYVFLALALLSVCLSGCQAYRNSVMQEQDIDLTYKNSLAQKAEYDLAKPIDCSRAIEDIKVLESEKASSQEQLKSGVKMVIPVAAARSILHRDYLNKGMVLIGEYNHDIDEKIKEIKNQCGLAK